MYNERQLLRYKCLTEAAELIQMYQLDTMWESITLLIEDVNDNNQQSNSTQENTSGTNRSEKQQEKYDKQKKRVKELSIIDKIIYFVNTVIKVIQTNKYDGIKFTTPHDLPDCEIAIANLRKIIARPDDPDNLSLTVPIKTYPVGTTFHADKYCHTLIMSNRVLAKLKRFKEYEKLPELINVMKNHIDCLRKMFKAVQDTLKKIRNRVKITMMKYMKFHIMMKMRINLIFFRQGFTPAYIFTRKHFYISPVYKKEDLLWIFIISIVVVMI